MRLPRAPGCGNDKATTLYYQLMIVIDEGILPSTTALEQFDRAMYLTG
jgi:hypothetical protein